jgi:hypothetical protein
MAWIRARELRDTFAGGDPLLQRLIDGRHLLRDDLARERNDRRRKLLQRRRGRNVPGETDLGGAGVDALAPRLLLRLRYRIGDSVRWTQ